MSLWGDVDNFFNGGANDAVNQGYSNAQAALSPWQQGGQQAFNQWQNNTTNEGNYLNQFQNMGQGQWNSTQMSPQQYYQNIMQGYQISPQAQYNMQMAQRAGNSAAAASGMMGSGAFVNAQQRNANQISQGDQQQYFDNTMGANQAQMQALQNYQQQQMWYNQMLQNQSQLGANAASQASQNSMNNGQQNAYWDNQGLNNMAGLAGMIGNAAMSYL